MRKATSGYRPLMGWWSAHLPATLEPGGSAARGSYELWWVLLIAGGLTFVLVTGLLVVGLRRREPGEHPSDARDEPTSPSRGWLGLAIGLPTVVVTVILAATVAAMQTDDREPSLMIDVVGHRWWWEVTYPDHGIVTANEIHLPAGEPVLLRLRSADVVHSLWVPELAGKLDLLPERTNELLIDADRPGRYPGRCAEFCGVHHANMDIDVVAHDPDEFERWVADQRRPAADPTGDAADGLVVFERRGCAECHAVGGLVDRRQERGPDLTHLTSRRSIAGGMLSTGSDDLRRWITDPHAVKAEVLMPRVQLSPAEIDALVAFLETLR